jgi:hypothetical protein
MVGVFFRGGSSLANISILLFRFITMFSRTDNILQNIPNQWLSLAKIALKVPLAGRNRLLVANTDRCGEGSRLLITCIHLYNQTNSG